MIVSSYCIDNNNYQPTIDYAVLAAMFVFTSVLISVKKVFFLAKSLSCIATLVD